MREVKLAVIQMSVICGDVSANLAGVAKQLNAIREPYDIAVFPECFDFGWANPDTMDQVMPIPNAVTAHLCKLAIEKNIHIVAGITEREQEKLYNTSVLIDNKGKIIGKHRKINILTEVEYMYSVGTGISVFDTIHGKIGIPICADNSMPSIVLAEAMARMGCELILSPCSWAVDRQFIQDKKIYGKEWVEPYQKIASTYEIPMVGVSNVGKVTCGVWEGWSCIGNSIIVSPYCDVVALPFGEDAECSKVVTVKLYDRPALGTKLSGIVAKTGYFREQKSGI